MDLFLLSKSFDNQQNVDLADSHTILLLFYSIIFNILYFVDLLRNVVRHCLLEYVYVMFVEM